MRHYTKKEVPAKTAEYLDKTTCDLCGREAKAGHWESSIYAVAEVEVEVTVRHKDGESYPEGGSGTEIVVDMCPQCFTGKLVPWLRTQGAEIEEKNWDW